MRSPILVFLLLALPLRADIDAFARKAMQTIGTTPGMTVVVVKDDKIVYRGDFGLRDVVQKLPIDPNTRFYNGSSTKAFTAMAAIILAEEGKLELDAPITTVWKELKLTPPLDANNFTLRDFLAMRPGMNNATLNYRKGALGNLDEAETLRVLATYSSPLPRSFRYSNMSYDIAATVMQKATGKTWQELVTEKVLAPLGMNSTVMTIPSSNAALFYHSTAPHVFVRDPGKSPEMMGPAGGMYMTSSDAAKWLIAMINERTLPKRAIRYVQSPQTTNKARRAFFDRFAWGFGQDLGEYEGELFVHRFGGFAGAYSHLSFMPERRIGVAVFANGGSLVADAVAAYSYDLLLGKKDLDAKWSAELTRLAAAAQKSREERAKTWAPLLDRKPPARALAAYAGSYHYDRLGRLEVRVEGGRLIGQLGVVRSELVPAGGDKFVVAWLDDPPVPVEFAIDDQGRATKFVWGDRIFERVP